MTMTLTVLEVATKTMSMLDVYKYKCFVFGVVVLFQGETLFLGYSFVCLFVCSFVCLFVPLSGRLTDWLTNRLDDVERPAEASPALTWPHLLS